MILVVIIEQIVASLPPSTRLEYLQCFDEHFHLVTDLNNPDDIESDLVNCLLNLEDWVNKKDAIISYLSYIEHMVNWLEKQKIPVPIAVLPLTRKTMFSKME